MTPAEKILQKVLVTSGLSSTEWNGIQAALRDRAFFSSRIEETRYLYEARQKIAEALKEVRTKRETFTTREDAIDAIMKKGREIYGEGKGGLRDPSSKERAKVIVDTNAGLAAGYVQHEMQMTLGARLVNPCRELVRGPNSNPLKPRDWNARWRAAGGQTYGGRLIATVESDVWSKISRFSSPYPPFDYNSGMITLPVSWEESVKLGIIKDDYKPIEKPIQKGFNDDLKMEVPYKGNSKEYKSLVEIFGDQITHQNGAIQWRAGTIREAFESKEPFELNLGKPTEKLLSMLDESQKKMLKQKSFTITDKWLRETDRHGYDHFEGEETRETNIPLLPGDLDMLPSMWRNPDRVIPSRKSKSIILLEIDTLDGGVLTGVVKIDKTPYLMTYYKRKASYAAQGTAADVSGGSY